MIKKFKLKTKIVYILLILLSLVVIFPIIFTVSSSFMDKTEIAQNFGEVLVKDAYTPIHIIPSVISTNNYIELLIRNPQYLYRFFISLLICIIITAGQVILSIFGGYAFSKFKFPGRDGIFFMIIILMLLPYQVTLVPTYMVVRALGLLNTSYSLILPGIFSAFGIFLMRQMMLPISDSILEAASLDGANSFKRLWRVVVPSCSSGVCCLTVLCFVDAWNMVEQPIVFITDTFKQPFSLLLLSINNENMALGFSCGVLSIIPVVLLLLLFEKQIVKGIGYSVLK